MLFATKRERPDTGTTISYLKTRLGEPHESNSKKMIHLFKYVIDTKYLPLNLSAKTSGIIKW